VKWLSFSGYHRHILIVALLGLYLVTANNLYTQFILKHGKPAQVEFNLPAESGEMTYKLAEMRPVRVDGEDVYQLKGFAFNPASKTTDYRITVVLISEETRLAFKTQPVDFPSIIRSSKLFEPGMDDAEFRALISKRVLDSGTYRIGILLEEKYGEGKIFTMTEGTLFKTANTVRFKAGL